MAESMLHEAIRCTLKNWTALQLAIQHGMGGPYGDEKERWMVDVIENFFQENEDLDPEEVEEFIGEIMDNEFNTITEDGSISEVSNRLCQFYKLCQDGNEEEVRKQIPAPIAFTSKNCVAMPDSDNEEAVSAEGAVQQLQALSVNKVNGESTASDNQETLSHGNDKDDDGGGWTVVQRRKK